MLNTAAMLDGNTGELVERAKVHPASSVASISHNSKMATNQWLQMQASRECGATSEAGSARHDVNCCCLACCLRHNSEHPHPDIVYQRLSAHEAGNCQSYLTMSREKAGAASASPRAFGYHPQIPHGFLSPRNRRQLMPDNASYTGDKVLAQLQGQDFERKGLPFRAAVRGGRGHALLFSAKVDGLLEAS